MWVVKTQRDIDDIESRRALSGVFVDRNYNPEKIGWLFEAKKGFNSHAGNSWHLLIPYEQGYGVDLGFDPKYYGVELAAAIIDKLGMGYKDLPCIAFRAQEEEFYYLKLGNMDRDSFCEEIGLIADVARKCDAEGPQDPVEYRDYVNMQVCIHLRRRKLLSATKRALPAISSLLGVVVDINELV